VNQQSNPLPAEVNAAFLATSAAAGATLVFLLPLRLPWPVKLLLVLAFGAGIASFLMAGIRQAIEQATGKAHRDAVIDPATKLATPRLADLTLAAGMAAARRGHALTVALIRIEEFGRYTARHGSEAGVSLLRTAARVVRRRTRSMHLAAHYGRSETTFLAVLSDVPVAGATVYAKRLRGDFAALTGLPEPVTVSVGLAAFEPDITTPRELLNRAERALERASAGGGKIVVAARKPTAAE
jgi:diguanylate cyclase (GGDEF)-like protein